MQTLIWIGAAVSMMGLLGLVWCIFTVWKARKSGAGDDALRAVVQKVVPLNTAALFLSVIGLMMVVLGIILS